MDRRKFIKVGAALSVAPEIMLSASERKLPAQTNYGYAAAEEAPMDLYLSWDDGDGTPDLRVEIRHLLGRCGYSFDQRHTAGRHFAGTYFPGDKPSVSVSAASDSVSEALPVRVEWVPSARRSLHLGARPTMTPLTLNIGDEFYFTLMDGSTRHVRLLSTEAQITETGTDPIDGRTERVTQYRYAADFTVDGEPLRIERINPKQSSFFEKPLIVGGMMIWLDAVKAIFDDAGGFMGEKDYESTGITCRPKRDARIVVQDASLRVCPGAQSPWFPGSERPHKVRICYHGRDTWMGTWTEGGSLAHGGLDINMPSGTILTCPIDVDTQYLFKATARGDKNNRWRAERKFPDGTVWWLQAHHINFLLPGIEEHTPLRSGVPYADTAGTFFGAYEHTHFCLRIFDGEEDFWLDPWLLMRDCL